MLSAMQIFMTYIYTLINLPLPAHLRLLQILLLDEATSALDVASEAIVTQALNDLATGSKPRAAGPPLITADSNRLDHTNSVGACSASSLERHSAAAAAAATAAAAAASGGRTTIIVAHRLATITAADTIAVLSTGGKLLEIGSPAQLLGNGPGGHYAQMVMQQHHATPLAAAAAALQK